MRKIARVGALKNRIIAGALVLLILVAIYPPFNMLSPLSALASQNGSSRFRFGIYDMLVGCSDENQDGVFDVQGYRNSGNTTHPIWTRTDTWDVDEAAGGSSRASPCFADLDNDGDYDLLISNANIRPKGYRNVGDRTNPIWSREEAWDLPFVEGIGGLELNPSLVDIDGDGDYDLALGLGAGNYTAFFENTGTVSSPTWTYKQEWEIPLTAGFPCPAFVDLDNDDDFDMLLGSYEQDCIQIWINSGNSTNPAWSRDESWEWDLHGLPTDCYKRPALVDLDNDGQCELMVGVGSPFRNITAYDNTGNLVPDTMWIRKPSWDIPLPDMSWIRPAFAELDYKPVYDLNTGFGYGGIQEAIDAPATLNGHTLAVNPGSYSAPITIDKSLSITGEGPEDCWINPDGSYTGKIVEIKCSLVNFTGFNITSPSKSTGLFFNNVNNCNVQNNIIVGPGNGIDSTQSNYNTISNNVIECSNKSICLRDFSNHTTIRNNTMQKGVSGINIGGSSYNNVYGNSVNSSTTGIYLRSTSTYNNITLNSIQNCTYGVLLYWSDDNYISDNVACMNEAGIFLWSARRNKVTGNSLIGNEIVGICCYLGASNNTIYNNFLKNKTSALDIPGNVWNASESSLAGCWSLDTGQGGVAHDLSGNGNDGTIYGAADGMSWTVGKYRNALGFDDADSYIEIPSSASLSIRGDQITMKAWICPNATGSEHKILCKESSYELALSQEGTIKWRIQIANPGWVWVDTGAVAPLNFWTYVAVSYDGSSVKTYVDRVLAHEQQANGNLAGNANPLHIGRFFSGKIDEICVYNRSLTSDEVARDRNIVGGPLIRGNYWSNNPNPTDTNDDGIGDTPYTINEPRKDYSPLVPRWPNVRESRNVTVDEHGIAFINLSIVITESELSSIYRTMLAAEVLPLDQWLEIAEFRRVPYSICFGKDVTVESEFATSELWLQVRERFLIQIAAELNATLGFGVEITGSSMRYDSIKHEFEMFMSGYSSVQIVNVTPLNDKYTWEILVGPLNQNSSGIAAGVLATKISFAQELLDSLAGIQEYRDVSVTRITMPPTATIQNLGYLNSLNWHLVLGGGTCLNASVSVVGSKCVVLNETLLVTRQDMDMNTSELVESYGYDHVKEMMINVTVDSHPYALTPREIPDWGIGWDTNWQCSLWKVENQFELKENIGESGTVSANVTVATSAAISGYMGLGVKGKGWHSAYLWVEAWLRPEVYVRVDVQAKATVNCNERLEIDIYTYRIPHVIDTCIFGIPLWADLKFKVVGYACVKAAGSAAINYTATYKSEIKIGARWQSNSGFRRIYDPRQSCKKSGPWIDLDASIEMGAGIKSKLELLFYSVAGPFGEVELYGKINFVCGRQGVGKWTIQLGLTARAGFAIDIEIRVKINLGFLGTASFKFTYRKEWVWATWEVWSKSWSGTMRFRPINPPVARLAYSPELPVSGDRVRFDGSESDSPDGYVTNWKWCFTNVNGTQTAIEGSDKQAIWVSFRPGSDDLWYEVNLTVTDTWGNASSLCEYFRVLEREVAVDEVALPAHQPDFAYVNWPVPINVHVENLGEAPEVLHVAILYGPQPYEHMTSMSNLTSGFTIANFTVYLPPGCNTTLKYVWVPKASECGHNWYIWAAVGNKYSLSTPPYPEPSLNETSQTNNLNHTPSIFHLRILGDVNGDGRVTILDVVSICTVFGSEDGPDFHWWKDFNQDGRINIFDVVLACINYGKHE